MSERSETPERAGVSERSEAPKRAGVSERSEAPSGRAKPGSPRAQ
jgi:hypothetical protein